MNDVLRRNRHIVIAAVCVVAMGALAGATPALAAASSPNAGTPSPSTTILPGPTDGWQPQSAATDPWALLSLDAVDFADADHGWAVGAQGVIIATSDGGATWQVQRPGSATAANLSAVAFAGSMNGWAVGSGLGSTVLTTTDGGATWTSQPVSGASSLAEVAAVDATHAWAMGTSSGQHSTVYATSDGGATWHAHELSDLPNPTALTFSDATHGWAVGFDGCIVATDDGGTTWHTQDSHSTATLNSVSFSDSQHGWAAGFESAGIFNSRAVILVTDDGGTTWDDQGMVAGIQSGFYEVKRTDALHGWAVGVYAGVHNAIMATSDGGATWQLQAVTPQQKMMRAVDAVDAQHAWAVGDCGTIMATTDGGASSDVTPPVSSLTGTGGDWRQRWVLGLSADDGAGGSGVACREFSVGSQDEWQRGLKLVLTSSDDHAFDGTRTVWYRAVDQAGNIEGARRTTVRIDTRKPWTRVQRQITAAHGGVARLWFSVMDGSPCAGWARARIRVYAVGPGGNTRMIRVINVGRRSVNERHSAAFLCDFPRGTYFLQVMGIDAAGNRGGGGWGFLHVN